MQNIKLVLEYDGTGYVGWQSQPNGPSIQQELEKAIGTVTQQQSTTVAAGRTDAGVHARGQVVSTRLPDSVEVGSFARSLNALLPPQIVVLSAERVPDDFHARYSARGRVYRYILALKPTAMGRSYSWYVGGYRLDRELLVNCAALLLGQHDFQSFCKSGSESENFCCIVDKSEWAEDGSSLTYTIRANRFLYGMVRAIVGTTVEIARKHRPPEDMKRILGGRDRSLAGMAAPAKGLFLEEIIY